MREPAPSTYPSVQAFVREAREGVCPLCDEPLPPRVAKHGRARVHCGAYECLMLYHRLVKIDVRRRAGCSL